MDTNRLCFVASLVVAAFLIAGCSDDPGVDADTGPQPDVDLGDAGDVETHDVDAPDVPDTDVPTVEAEYCEPCERDADCIDEGARCIELPDGEQACGLACETDGDDCPEDATCATIDADDTTQCVPTRLTCIERCDDVECPGGEYCDPLTGSCEPQPRICETGCQFDSQCGDPDEHRCLSTGAPDGETMCTINCDPNADAEEDGLECPSDFVCAPLEEGGDEGVCFPLARTCVDRCHDVDCPAGHNCDGFTGECVEAIAGACEDTCEIDAHCEGQRDLCLAIGIGEGSHCWQDCTSDQTCPDGYECTAFLGLTTNLCIPPAQQCQECYEADCFPDGICNPTTGECMPHPEDCTVEGCDGDQLCEPVSKRCVDRDRSCSGDSWAVDCDNVVTRCTSQRSGTDGVCATICFGDEDCAADRQCTSTIHGDLCLPPDLGGPQSCGVLNESGAELGQPCGENAGSCAPDHHCVETGGVPGFCSRECDSAGDCPDGAACQIGPGGQSICLPVQCQCVADPLLSDPLADGWNEALDEVGLSVCDLQIPAPAIEAAGDWNERPFRTPSLAQLSSHPVAGLGTVHHYLDLLDDTADHVELLAQAPSIMGMTNFDTDPTLEFVPPLAQALVDFSDTAGGDLDPTQTEAAVEDIPTDVQTLAAHLVVAIDEAYQARLDAFDQAGLDEAQLETLFEETHRLFLPRASTQAALDLTDPDLMAAVDDFPLEQLIQIAIELSANVESAIESVDLDPQDLAGDEFFVVIDTPAGAVVIGDATDRVYDADTEPLLAGPMALNLDIGGHNEYRIPVAANQSIANGISVLVDLTGDDLYGYATSASPLDGERLLTSDEAGRLDESGDDGPVSLSETARQGSGRLGIGLLFDRDGSNEYETLRMGQGAAVLGVGALFDLGDGPSSFESEALSQGASMAGLGLLYSAGGDNTYRLWHAGQGFGTASGMGILFDGQGSDTYTAVTGTEDSDDILYDSPTDGGMANRSLAQGATSGGDALAAGIGMLRDQSGHDTYLAGSYAQGFGEHQGLGIFADADGDDSYGARNFAHGTGRDAGAGLLIDTGGDDALSQSAVTSERGQGAGDTLGWGVFQIEGGENTIDYNVLGGGLGFDGGLGFALFSGGPNAHDVIGGGFGLATYNAEPDSPLGDGWTVGLFVQTGEADDHYEHPSESLDIDNDSRWRQDDEDAPRAVGVGLDQ